MSFLSRAGLLRAYLASDERTSRSILLGALLAGLVLLLLVRVYGNEPGPLCSPPCHVPCTDSAWPPPPGTVCTP